MKKDAVIIGGSNGIGLAVAMALVNRGYHVYILDKVKPDVRLAENHTYYYCDLLDFDEPLIQKMASNKNADTLFISAGVGRIADFEFLHSSEIENLLKVNTVSTIKIIKEFYGRIKNKETFYCGIMGSIAGLVSSPMFSTYAASKAAVYRFVESVNIELEANDFANRILNVSPGSIEGTRFNGGENQLELLNDLSTEIIQRLFSSDELFIPEYDTIYKDALDRYSSDPRSFGLRSYQYKKESGRASNKKETSVGYLSGTFDLFHIGHLNIIKKAKEQCDYLIVGVHASGKWKGKESFIPFDERKAIVSAIKPVDQVVDACREDSDTWREYKYDKLFVGSDYKGTERFARYAEYFREKGVEIIFFPYTRSTSSTQVREFMLSRINENKEEG